MVREAKVITRDMLQSGLPPIVYTGTRVNSVLALRADGFYSPNGSNSYLDRWDVANTEWYTRHSEQYLGWIPLEEVPLPQFTEAA
jgi:hypothetical protein